MHNQPHLDELHGLYRRSGNRFCRYPGTNLHVGRDKVMIMHCLNAMWNLG